MPQVEDGAVLLGQVHQHLVHIGPSGVILRVTLAQHLRPLPSLAPALVNEQVLGRAVEPCLALVCGHLLKQMRVGQRPQEGLLHDVLRLRAAVGHGQKIVHHLLKDPVVQFRYHAVAPLPVHHHNDWRGRSVGQNTKNPKRKPRDPYTHEGIPRCLQSE